MGNSGSITIDADIYLRLLDRLKALEDDLRKLGHGGFTSSGKVQIPDHNGSAKPDEAKAMALDIDISGIEWRLSNRDGGILREALQLIQAIEQYGRVRIGQYEITLGGRNKRLLNRKKLKYGGR